MNEFTFTDQGFADYVYWQNQDKKTLNKINRPLFTALNLTVHCPLFLEARESGCTLEGFVSLFQCAYRAADC